MVAMEKPETLILPVIKALKFGKNGAFSFLLCLRGTMIEGRPDDRTIGLIV